MTKKTSVTIVSLLILALVGCVVGYWGIKKWRAKQRQEYKYEVSMGTPASNFEQKIFKSLLLADEVCESIIKEHQLESKWSCSSAEAKEKLFAKTTITATATELKVGYQDRDTDLAKTILKAIALSFQQRRQGTWKPYGK